MSGGVRNVFMENCKIGSVASAIYFKSNLDRGGIIENIHIRNIQVDTARGAFVRFETNYKGHRGNHFPPVFQNFTLDNISCKEANVGIYAVGHKDALLKNIHLKDITINNVITPYYINHFKNFSMIDVKMNEMVLPEHPPINMEKPKSLNMGW